MSDRAELIARPLSVWLAPAGTTFPELGTEPDDPWKLVVLSMPENLGEDGVTVALPQSLNEFYGSSVMMVEVFRSEETVTVSVPAADMRLEVWQHALEQASVEEAGTQSLDLERGPNVRKVALLARGQSPYDRDLEAQFELPRCYQSGEVEAQFAKADPAELELEFTAVKPLPGERIRLVAQEPVDEGAA